MEDLFVFSGKYSPFLQFDRFIFTSCWVFYISSVHLDVIYCKVFNIRVDIWIFRKFIKTDKFAKYEKLLMTEWSNTLKFESSWKHCSMIMNMVIREAHYYYSKDAELRDHDYAQINFERSGNGITQFLSIKFMTKDEILVVCCWCQIRENIL